MQLSVEKCKLETVGVNNAEPLQDLQRATYPPHPTQAGKGKERDGKELGRKKGVRESRWKGNREV